MVEIIAFLEFVALIFHVRTVHKFPHRVLAMLKVGFSRGSRKWNLKNNLSQGRRWVPSPSTSCSISLPAFLIEEFHTYKVLTNNQFVVVYDELPALSVNIKQPRSTNAKKCRKPGILKRTLPRIWDKSNTRRKLTQSTHCSVSMSIS